MERRLNHESLWPWPVSGRPSNRKKAQSYLLYVNAKILKSVKTMYTLSLQSIMTSK